jgi:hypothetical protein
MSGLLFGSAASAQAASTIPLRTVPPDIKATIQSYVPGSRLTGAKISADSTYGPIYRCDYSRFGHTGTIQIGSLKQLVDIKEILALANVPVPIRQTIKPETKGGAVQLVRLSSQNGRPAYKVKAIYGKASNRQIAFVVSRNNRVVSRNVSGRSWFFSQR